MSKKQPISIATLVSQETIERKIYLIRGKKVMLGPDLASLYGVETKILNRVVKRHAERFPDDFMFRLSAAEKTGVEKDRTAKIPMKFLIILPPNCSGKDCIIRKRRAIVKAGRVMIGE